MCSSDLTACKSANPCPDNYYIQIRMCCDPDRIEVAQVPANFMIFSEGLIFSDTWSICWEVMSIDTTGTETYQIYNWSGPNKPKVYTYGDCQICKLQNTCFGFYEIQECGGTTITIVILDGIRPIGSFFYDNGGTCYQIVGYATPTFSEIYPTIYPSVGTFESCDECTASAPGLRTLELLLCCDGSTLIANVTGPWVGGYGSTQLIDKSGSFICATLVGLSTAPTTSIATTISPNKSCISCTARNPCA